MTKQVCKKKIDKTILQAQGLFDFFVKKLERRTARNGRLLNWPEKNKEFCIFYVEDDELSVPADESAIFDWRNEYLIKEEHFSYEGIAKAFKACPMAKRISKGPFKGYIVKTSYIYNPLTFFNDEWWFKAEIILVKP